MDLSREEVSTEQLNERRLLYRPTECIPIMVIGRQRLLARITSGWSVSNKVAAWQGRRQLSRLSGPPVELADADLLVALRRMHLDVAGLLISFRQFFDYHGHNRSLWPQCGDCMGRT